MSVSVAIIGSGQLARMMALDGIPMGLSFSFLAESGEDTRCVDSLGPVVLRDATDSAETLFQKLGSPKVVTVEKEHVDVPMLKGLAAHCPVHPNPEALTQFKNRRVEKEFLQSLNIPIAPFKAIGSAQDARDALAALNQPIFLKSEEEGYDGYNQHRLTDQTAEQVIAELSFPSHWVAEAFIPFEREVSFLAARSTTGEIIFYPAVENYHRNGTLLTSIAPAPELSDAQRDLGRQYLGDILKALDYVGLICMECFVHGDELLVNEIAPRVHNSGHWTSKGALTSQFENHVRAVSGLPLGSTQTHGLSGMLNLLGVAPTVDQVSDESTFLTLYGKTVRAKRKLGHVTIKDHDYAAIRSRLAILKQSVYGTEAD